MRGKILAAMVLCFLFVSIPSFSQTGNAQLSGVVTDQSGALIPGVTITLTKTDTGVVRTTITNEAGVYNFQGLPPGSGYTATAALPGFQAARVTGLELAIGSASRRNFQLQVATAATTVEVSVEAGLAALTETSSVGDVLSRDRIESLPLVGNNVLNLLNILPGVRFNGTGAWMGDYANTIGGQSLDSVNVTLDGLPTRDERFSASSGTFQSQNFSGGTGGGQSTAFIEPGGYTGGTQMLSTTTLNPDLVGEIKLILAPVDAELGRGNSQIQITTRSGTNRFTGAAVWNIQNTSLNPNTWNRNNDRGNSTTGCTIKGQAPPCWKATQPDWRNTNQYTVSFGGPIVRNKTFFFVLWDQQISNTRALQTNTVLTDTARNGIFRYWEGWVPGDAGVGITTSTSNPNPQRPAVDFDGKALAPATWLSGAPYTGRMVCFSVFGAVKSNGSPFGTADCPNGTDVNGRAYTGIAITPPAGALWDPKRPAASAAALGYFAKLLQEMPKPNYYASAQADGLNTASFRWLLGRKGGNDIAGGLGGGNAGQNALVGSAAYQNRKQINIKIDQNFGKHRIAGNWTRQADDSAVPFAQWPNGISGLTHRGPQTVAVNVTSTLSSSMLNEGRFGLNLDKAYTVNPWNLSDTKLRDRARSFELAGGSSSSGNGKIYPVLVSPATGGLNFGGGLLPSTAGTDTTFSNPLYDIADTFSWTHGKQAYKFGADFRFPRSKGTNLQPIPQVSYGNRGGTITESPFANAGNSPSLGTTGTPDATNTTNLFPQNARNQARDLAYLLTNSLGGVNTPYWAENFAQISAGVKGWQDVTTQANRVREMVFNDYSFFAKDDWKLTPSLTLNLGVRYEYYAPPYITSGLTSAIVDQGNGLFGAGRGLGAGFGNWLAPGNLYFTGYGTNGTGPGTNGLGSAAISLNCSKTAVGTFASRLPAPNCDPKQATDIEFIGPNSPNPGKSIIPQDRNNFGPAVGFAWQVPWFGQGKTTVRGGYQLIYQRVSIGEGTLASALGGFLDQATNENDPAVQAIAGAGGLNRALLLSDLPALVPVPPSRAPGRAVPVYGRSESVTAFDPHFNTPYTQNLTLTVTRSLSRQFSLDLRYVGALSRKQPGNIDLNASTVYDNKELFDALTAARRGENPVLLDQLLAGVDLAGTGNTIWSIGGVTGTYPTDRMYGPVGTCMTLVDVPGFQTPPLPGDPRCAAGQVFNSGAEHLRRATTFGPTGGFGAPDQLANRLANGTFGLVTGILAGGFVPTGGLQPSIVPVGGTTPSQRLLRNGCDRIGNGLYDASASAVYPTVDPVAASFGVVRTGNIPTRCFPENYLIANPQLGSANFNGNFSRNNYHSLEVQFTMRPLHGLSFQSTYTMAKSMGVPSSGYNDPRNRDFDRQKGAERAHDFRMNGTFEVPFGPNKLLFGNSSGWLARAVERWQTGFIFNVASGAPQTLAGARATRYATSGNFQPYGNARLNPTEYWKIPKGKVEFPGGVVGNAFGAFGNAQSDLGTYFGVDAPGNVGSYTTVIDPQCFDPKQVAQIDSKGFGFAKDSAGCTLRALAQRVPVGTPGSFLLNPSNPTEIAAHYVLVNPKPGEYGVLTPNVLTRFGNWSFDANIQKAFDISESKRVTIRIDAKNVLNHPEPFIPLFTTNDVFISQFGVIECGCGDSKSGTRTFQGQVRFSF